MARQELSPIRLDPFHQGLSRRCLVCSFFCQFSSPRKCQNHRIICGDFLMTSFAIALRHALLPPFLCRLARKLLLLSILTAGAMPVWADYVVGTCTIRVPTPPATECPGADLSGANLTGVDLSSANLNGANLYNVVLTNAVLANTDLSNADLNKVKSGSITGTPAALPVNWRLINGYLVGPGARLKSADLTGANLANLDLNGTELWLAILDSANLSNTVLTNVSLSSAHLPNATLISANLTDANLYGADLTNANLANANLTNVYLGNANLSGAVLTGAILSGVGWNNTTCPDGTNSNLHISGSCMTPLDAVLPLNGTYKGSAIKETTHAQ
ncbi:MAG TPA: pentapeptide repeat-containing protein [Pseudomonadales bacterium]|nr:pentapeptide repeat-containing protein [Pseudomonadales bacterium]